MCLAYKRTQNFFPCVRRSRGPALGVQDPQRDRDPITKKPKFPAITKSMPGIGPNRRKFDGNLAHPLTLSDHSGPGVRGRGSISPGEGDGAGSNSLPRTIRIAVWEIFSGSSRSGKFFHRFSLRVCATGEIFSGVFALQENNFGPKNSDSSRESAAAPPVRDSPKFFSNTILF